MSFLFPLIRPVLHAMDAEDAHNATIKALKCGLYPKDRTPPNPMLKQNVFGLDFTGPVGMAAGFDKDAQVLSGLFAHGFNFVEAGTVTPKPQEGNPRPRVFRDKESQSVINRMGFPGHGADVFFDNYQKFRQKGRYKHGIVGINLGKNKDTENALDDYGALIARFAPHADYLSINISSPNTPGLRDLQSREKLLPLLQGIREILTKTCDQLRPPPLLVKLAPDLTSAECEDIAQTLMAGGIDGIISTNTTLQRPDGLPQEFSDQAGGLSGPLLRDQATEMIARFYKLTNGTLPIIGVGGISSAMDAYKKIRSGASLIQIYTALVYQGPGLVKKIQNDLVELLKQDGFENIKQAVGADYK